MCNHTFYSACYLTHVKNCKTCLENHFYRKKFIDLYIYIYIYNLEKLYHSPICSDNILEMIVHLSENTLIKKSIYYNYME